MSWRCVVAVYAFEEHFLSVDIDLRVGNANIAETVFCTESHLFAVAIELLNTHSVEVGGFSRPRHKVGHVDIEVSIRHIARRESHFNTFLTHQLTCWIVEFNHQAA